MAWRYLWLMKSPFRYFDSSPEVIRLAVQMYVRYPLSLRTVHAALHNHFNQDRHLISRHDYKGRRSAAQAEWRSLMA